MSDPRPTATEPNFPGKSALYALKPIQKLSSLKRVVQHAKPSESVSLAMFVASAWNMRSHMMNVSVFGEASPSVSAAA
jgi:hypothetical protein